MILRTAKEIEDARAAAGCVVETHRRLADWLRPGLTLAEVDAFCAQAFEQLKCKSAFIGYKVRGHPPFRSHTCLSLNDMVVHGEHDATLLDLLDDEPAALGVGELVADSDGFLADHHRLPIERKAEA